jgi:hypothetical protein
MLECRERTMNTSAADNVVVELADGYEPAEALISWAERKKALD